MAEHYCQFVVALNYTGDTFMFCDSPASLKYSGTWVCAGHFDLLEGEEKQLWVVGEQGSFPTVATPKNSSS